MNEIYIGDNLNVMSNETFKKYYGAVKMIYTDPPYNTKSKKAYKDSFSNNDWINFMYDRISASKKLLREDGVIFISIDDNEFSELKSICDSVFGCDNYIGTFITMQSQRSNAKLINTVHEYILSYAKNKKKVKNFSIKRTSTPEGKELIDNLYKEIKTIIKNEGIASANLKIKKIVNKYCFENNIDWLKNYANIDDNGRIYFPIDLSTPGKPRIVDIPSINLHLEPLKTRGWSTDEKFVEVFNEGRLVFRNGRPYKKHYIEESEDNVSSILKFYSRMGTKNLKDLGIDGVFDTPKPVELIKYLLRITSCGDNDVVLDFFAGSGTMAQAVYEVNSEDKKSINYILIQQKEDMQKGTEPYEKCLAIGINPKIEQVMLFRINKFLELYGMKKDYNLAFIE